ncbi:Sugar kinase of the NBD/HSP70 family, may contain an N-terminal HTH domain [Tindallia magadiensis]|uniref:Sugar kinase of the NBD/HSP70 family, may contain an N-terminal HTH domain n=1 Tax=Tindallia magadiensis TaxID=69895 RepID=A0A1I3HM04_9FIRM|nr:ROK family transcriptional regulator [Tindallia magadiensis]SFI36775.1 Sugar kinase of the NBD/HSP70 family, may contain an N-terminal HTH domain [Tindallia magadiensis]
MQKPPSSLAEMKIENLKTVFCLIQNNPGITRVELTEKTQVTSMSVTRMVALLKEANLIVESDPMTHKQGRPAKHLYVQRETAHFLVAYLDVDAIVMAVINLNNEIIVQETIKATELSNMKSYVHAVEAVYQDWIKEKRVKRDHQKKIVFICPGIIDTLKGEVVLSTQLGWKNEKMAALVHATFGQEVILGNDVKSALLGEVFCEETNKEANIAYMDIGYGVGVALLINGILLRGTNNSAGEIGHITIDYNGAKCQCGRKGCLDTVLNIEALIRKAREGNREIHKVEDIVEGYRQNQPWATGLMEDVSRYFSIAINNIIYAYDPDKIVVGGKLIQWFPEFLEIVTASKDFEIYSESIENIKIEKGRQQERAYLLGGALEAQKQLLEDIFR